MKFKTKWKNSEETISRAEFLIAKSTGDSQILFLSFLSTVFIKFIPKYFTLSDAMLNWIIFLILFSDGLFRYIKIKLVFIFQSHVMKLCWTRLMVLIIFKWIALHFLYTGSCRLWIEEFYFFFSSLFPLILLPNCSGCNLQYFSLDRHPCLVFNLRRKTAFCS